MKGGLGALEAGLSAVHNLLSYVLRASQSPRPKNKGTNHRLATLNAIYQWTTSTEPALETEGCHLGWDRMQCL